jgi:hypothetical protein
MEVSMDSNLESQLSSLRVELKEWEHAFALKSGAQKPGREDIKRDPEIGLFGFLRLLPDLQA